MGPSETGRPTDSSGRPVLGDATGTRRLTDAGGATAPNGAAGSARAADASGVTVPDDATGSARRTDAGVGTVPGDATGSAPADAGGGTVRHDAASGAGPIDAGVGTVPGDATRSAPTDAGVDSVRHDARGGARPIDADGGTVPKDSTDGARTNDGAGCARSKVADEYVRVFELLSIPDVQKVQVLARLLQSLYDVTTKLDGHLATTGGAIHVAVSRMCEADNPLAAPQHRWIRIFDRLGFFSDGDEHACRIVNIGLSYAYRHKEVNVLTAANALRLRAGAASPVPDGDQITGHGAGQQQVPEGGIVVGRRPGMSPPIGGDSSTLPPAGADQPTLPPPGVNVRPPLDGQGPWDEGDAGSGGDAGLVRPEGGLVVRRHHDASGAGETVDDDVSPGGIIVATRAPGRQPDAVPAGSRPTLLGPNLSGDGEDAEASRIVSRVQPVVTPSDASIKCVSAVLEALRERQDIRHVLQQLVIDSLLCLGRLKGESAHVSASASAVAVGETGWSAVRAILYRWWPVWEVSAGDDMQRPPPGTVGYIAHPSRPILSSRWAIHVNMEAINAVIQNLQVKSGRYFDKNKLPPVVSVSRFGPNVRGVIVVSVATLLLVATKEDMFCTIVSDLMAQGRVPTMNKIPLLAATRHDFETAALEAPEVLVPDVPEPGVDHPAADHSDAAGPTLGMADGIEETPIEDLEKEMDLLRAQEEEQERASNRAHRIAVRRLSRPAEEPKQDVPAGVVENLPTSSAAPTAPTPSSPTAVSPPAAKRPRPNPIGLQGGAEGGPSALGASSMMHLCPPRRVTPAQPRPSARRPVKQPKPAPPRKRRRAPAGLNESSSTSSGSSSSDRLPILLRPRANVAGGASPEPLLPGTAFPSAAEREQTHMRVAASVAASRLDLAALAARRPTAVASAPPPSPPQMTPGVPAPSNTPPSAAPCAATPPDASDATAPAVERDKPKP